MTSRGVHGPDGSLLSKVTAVTRRSCSTPINGSLMASWYPSHQKGHSAGTLRFAVSARKAASTPRSSRIRCTAARNSAPSGMSSGRSSRVRRP
jgi:hypothetical protein